MAAFLTAENRGDGGGLSTASGGALTTTPILAYKD
jgi:hypothetical protein